MIEAAAAIMMVVVDRMWRNLPHEHPRVADHLVRAQSLAVGETDRHPDPVLEDPSVIAQPGDEDDQEDQRYAYRNSGLEFRLGVLVHSGFGGPALRRSQASSIRRCFRSSSGAGRRRGLGGRWGSGRFRPGGGRRRGRQNLQMARKRGP